ncbi:unnamed protein product [Amoebophrya sp. A120]|nr:unnamed protein product [Amoebophrya sp. A120]|eukprot:GSA120T00024412001.1
MDSARHEDAPSLLLQNRQRQAMQKQGCAQANTDKDTTRMRPTNEERPNLQQRPHDESPSGVVGKQCGTGKTKTCIQSKNAKVPPAPATKSGAKRLSQTTTTAAQAITKNPEQGAAGRRERDSLPFARTSGPPGGVGAHLENQTNTDKGNEKTGDHAKPRGSGKGPAVRVEKGHVPGTSSEPGTRHPELLIQKYTSATRGRDREDRPKVGQRHLRQAMTSTGPVQQLDKVTEGRAASVVRTVSPSADICKNARTSSGQDVGGAGERMPETFCTDRGTRTGTTQVNNCNTTHPTSTSRSSLMRSPQHPAEKKKADDQEQEERHEMEDGASSANRSIAEDAQQHRGTVSLKRTADLTRDSKRRKLDAGGAPPEKLDPVHRCGDENLDRTASVGPTSLLRHREKDNSGARGGTAPCTAGAPEKCPRPAGSASTDSVNYGMGADEQEAFLNVELVHPVQANGAARTDIEGQAAEITGTRGGSTLIVPSTSSCISTPAAPAEGDLSSKNADTCNSSKDGDVFFTERSADHTSVFTARRKCDECKRLQEALRQADSVAAARNKSLQIRLAILEKEKTHVVAREMATANETNKELQVKDKAFAEYKAQKEREVAELRRTLQQAVEETKAQSVQQVRDFEAKKAQELEDLREASRAREDALRLEVQVAKEDADRIRSKMQVAAISFMEELSPGFTITPESRSCNSIVAQNKMTGSTIAPEEQAEAKVIRCRVSCPSMPAVSEDERQQQQDPAIGEEATSCATSNLQHLADHGPRATASLVSSRPSSAVTDPRTIQPTSVPPSQPSEPTAQSQLPHHRPSHGSPGVKIGAGSMLPQPLLETRNHKLNRSETNESCLRKEQSSRPATDTKTSNHVLPAVPALLCEEPSRADDMEVAVPVVTEAFPSRRSSGASAVESDRPVLRQEDVDNAADRAIDAEDVVLDADRVLSTNIAGAPCLQSQDKGEDGSLSAGKSKEADRAETNQAIVTQNLSDVSMESSPSEKSRDHETWQAPSVSFTEPPPSQEQDCNDKDPSLSQNRNRAGGTDGEAQILDFSDLTSEGFDAVINGGGGGFMVPPKLEISASPHITTQINYSETVFFTGDADDTKEELIIDPGLVNSIAGKKWAMSETNPDLVALVDDPSFVFAISRRRCDRRSRREEYLVGGRWFFGAAGGVYTAVEPA